jgi:hypothetical protein
VILLIHAAGDFSSVLGKNRTAVELDPPASQRWKRNCVAKLGIAVAPRLHDVLVDFEHTTLSGGLAAGFKRDEKIAPKHTRDQVKWSLFLDAPVRGEVASFRCGPGVTLTKQNDASELTQTRSCVFGGAHLGERLRG